MDHELHCKLTKGNLKAFRELYRNELKRMWFICYGITNDVTTAVPLLLLSWKRAITKLMEAEETPRESIRVMVSAEILKAALGDIEGDRELQSVQPPGLPPEYGVFVEAIEKMAYSKRYIYLLTTFGGLDAATVASILGIPLSEAKQLIAHCSAEALDSPGIKRMDYSMAVALSTEFKNPNGKPFLSIEVPELVIATLEHDYQVIMKERGTTVCITDEGKESKKMKKPTQTPKRNTSKKSGGYAKIIAVTAVALAIIVALVIVLPKILPSKDASTRIVTYNVDEITYGNVTSTISGSGTLTPITKETLVSSDGGEVETVNFTVGDEVTEDDVIAVITSDDGDESIVAPCDGILIELPISAGDEVAKGGAVAMVMGKDGFTMGIAVDELDISSLALDQEVSFTIDAVSGDHTGTVTAISYNGTTSGGTTVYQITATLEYIEGVYPGMSASAEIVIEDSGEGLLVPVDAVTTSGDDSYIYLAPSEAELGTEFSEDELSLDDLAQVTVETGMSDGSYIMIESDDIAEGDLIIITKITSTLTGSDSDSNESGFGGGRGGFGGGMNFGDFDFENFDPSQMPQGGMGGFN